MILHFEKCETFYVIYIKSLNIMQIDLLQKCWAIKIISIQNVRNFLKILKKFRKI